MGQAAFVSAACAADVGKGDVDFLDAAFGAAFRRDARRCSPLHHALIRRNGACRRNDCRNDPAARLVARTLCRAAAAAMDARFTAPKARAVAANDTDDPVVRWGTHASCDDRHGQPADGTDLRSAGRLIAGRIGQNGAGHPVCYAERRRCFTRGARTGGTAPGIRKRLNRLLCGVGSTADPACGRNFTGDAAAAGLEGIE